MQKTIIIGIIAVAAIAGVLWWAAANENTDDTTMMKKESVVGNVNNENKAMEKKEDAAMQKTDDRYIEYSPENFANSASNRRVLFFYADWCPICRPADADFQTNENQIPSDVTVIRVNYNDTKTDQDEKDLAKEYGVTYQHTFVQIDSAGKAVATWNGGQTTELLSTIK